MNDNQIEHLARGAAEWGDTETEKLCDAALDDPQQSELLIDIINNSVRYQDWMLKGINRGYEAR